MLRIPFLLVVVVAAHAATPVFRASFDNPQQTWAVDRGSVVLDSSVLREGHKSIRLEPGRNSQDACVRLSPVNLTIGKRYELSGWVRTEDLTVRDLDRTPIANGATLSMASMPFDVHAASLGGTQPWTRVSLKFVASRRQDQILLTVGMAARFVERRGLKASHLDESFLRGRVAGTRRRSDISARLTVIPSAGWIYLHIEGKPYERGYQHGHLMAREIPEYLERCAADLGAKRSALGSSTAPRQTRCSCAASTAKFWKRCAASPMALPTPARKWQERRIDLMDIVVANTTVEMGELRAAPAA